jgi:hypothetical protein
MHQGGAFLMSSTSESIRQQNFSSVHVSKFEDPILEVPLELCHADAGEQAV